MTYPKPLSQKSVEKLYREAGMSGSVRDFLHDLFAACANLYGRIPLRDVWEIYKSYEKSFPKIRRKDLVTFSAIVRREEQPYQIYDIEELYVDEPHQDLDRYIISKELIKAGYNRLFHFYRVMENAAEKPYWVPDDLFAWTDPVPSEEETDLLAFLGELESETDEVTPKYGETCSNEYKGKKLKEFSFYTRMERIEIDLLKRPEQRNEFLKDCSGTEAEKLLRKYKRIAYIGHFNPPKNLEFMIEELNEAGVLLNEAHFAELVRLTTAFHNNSHLWCNAGWTPSDIAVAMYNSGQKPVISFGPGIQQVFKDGLLDRDEMIRDLRDHGFTVADQ